MMRALAVTFEQATTAHGAARALAVLAFVYLLAGYYVEPPFELAPGIVLPAATVVVALPALLLAVLSRVTRYDVWFLGGALVTFVVGAVLSPGSTYLGQKLLGIAQIMTSLTAGIVLVKVMDCLPRRTVSVLLAAGWGLILVGAFLEVIGPLRPLVVAFGELVYRTGGYHFYAADIRDLNLIGFPRPKLFTSEPSLVAIGFMMLANSWLVLQPSLGRAAAVTVATLVTLLLSGSPVLLVSLALSAALAWASTRRLRVGLCAAGLTVALAALTAIAVPQLAGALRERWERAVEESTTLEQTSENLRLVFPAITTVDVLAHSPVFGVGLSGKEVVASVSSLPFADFVTDVQVGNNLALLLIYLGLAGTTAYLLLWRWYAKRLDIQHVGALALLVLALSQCMGGFESPRFWGYVFLAVGAFRTAARRPASAPPLRPPAATISSVST